MSTIDSDTSSHSTGDNHYALALDETAWRAVCKAFAEQAIKGCGLSHDYYVELFSSAIDAEIALLPEFQRVRALEVAQQWNYATPAERQEAQDSNAENGYCMHGIDRDCCPAGCGDLEY